MKKVLKDKKGITLVSLVITIIILLILAGVTLSGIFGDSGIIGNSLTAKEKTEIANETEIVDHAVIEVMAASATGEITSSKLYEKLEGYNVKITEQNGLIIVTFEDTNRWYQIDENGNVSYLDVKEAKTIKIRYVQEDIKGVRAQIPNTEECEYTSLFEDYSIVPPEIEGYEPALEVVTGSIKDADEIEILYYLVYDEEELAFTEITVNGELQYAVSGINSGVKTDIKSVLRIPENYNGKKITQIKNSAFGSKKQIQKISISDSITTIGSSAFNGCTNTTELTVGASVNKVEYNGLNNLSSLKTVIYNGNVLKGFTNCPNWTEVKLSKDNEANYQIIDGMVYSADKTKLLVCPNGRTEDVIMQEGVTTIGAEAFKQCAKVKNITIATTAITIGSEAFTYCTEIEKIVIPDKVTTIGSSAFNGCTNTTELTVGATVNNVQYNAFYNLTSLETVLINSSTIANRNNNCNFIYGCFGKVCHNNLYKRRHNNNRKLYNN